MEREEHDIEELKKGFHANKEEINELKTVLMGPAPGRDNGVRGDLKHLREKLNDFIEEMEQLWAVKRKEECFGMEACEALEERVKNLEEGKTGTTQMGVAKLNLKGVYFLGLMTILGQILLIVKDLFPAGGK